MKTNLFNKALALSLLSFAFANNASAQQYLTVKKTPEKAVRMTVNKPTAMTAADATLKKPAKQISYQWVDGTWKTVCEYTYAYNEDGTFKTEEGTYFDIDGNFYYSILKSHLYNENGNVINSVEQRKESETDDWKETFHINVTYDEICPDIVVSQVAEKLENDQWVPDMNFCIYNDIVRDAQKRVTLNQQYLNDKKENPMLGYAFEYNSSEKPATNAKILLPDANGSLYTLYDIDNIKWHKSNEQYLKMKNNAYFLFTIDPDNIAASYDVSSYNENGQNQENGTYVSNTTDSKGRITASAILFSDGFGAVNAYEYDVDEFGSNNYYFFYFQDANGNKQYDKGEETSLNEASLTMNKYNDHKDLVSQEGYVFNVDTEAFDISTGRSTCDYVYNDDNTIAESMILVYDKDGNITQATKAAYMDYMDLVKVGISNVVSDDITMIVSDDCVTIPGTAGQAYMLCDMFGRISAQGFVNADRIDISHLADGAYIVKVNDRAFKIIKK